MRITTDTSFDGSSSAPGDAASTSGNGSVMASIFARGIAISRYTPQGSMQPFGQDTGTAGDNTVVSPVDVASNALTATTTAVDSKCDGD
jgi:hypothetical protein